MVEPNMEAAGIEPAQDSPGRHLHIVPDPTVEELESRHLLAVVRSAATGVVREHGGCVYFIAYENACKIGVTSGWPRKRFDDIQNMCPVPLELRAVMPGDVSKERALHLKFDRSRLHGEWFRLTRTLQRLIDENVQLYGRPDSDYGVPEYLFRIALADALDREEVERTLRKRQTDSRRLIARLATYERRGIEPPDSLLKALHRTAELLR